jgi:hypothetical protein
MIHKRKNRPGVSTKFLFLIIFLVPRGKRVGECTHMIVQILYKGIATGLAAQRASLMKEVVEAHEFAKLGEDLDESVSGERGNPLCLVQGQVPGETIRTHLLLDEDCQRTDGS